MEMFITVIVFKDIIIGIIVMFVLLGLYFLSLTIIATIVNIVNHFRKQNIKNLVEKYGQCFIFKIQF